MTKNPLDKLNKINTKPRDWSNKATQSVTSLGKGNSIPIPEKIETKPKKVQKVRENYSCKIFKGVIDKKFESDFGKVKKELYKLDYELGESTTIGDYLSFIMMFANKYELSDLFQNVGPEGNLNIDKKKLKAHFEKLLK